MHGSATPQLFSMTNEISDQYEYLLPPGWIQTTLANITQTINSRLNPKKFPQLPFISMSDVESGSMRLLNISQTNTKNSLALFVPANSVLYGRLRPNLNKVYSSDFEALCSPEFIVFEKSLVIEPQFLAYRLNSQEFVNFASQLAKGDRPRISVSHILSFRMMLPPLQEQRRIVVEVDRQFSILDAGIDNLKRAQLKLRIYRVSLLDAATTGKLIAAKATNGAQPEHTLTLLQDILQDRRTHWDRSIEVNQHTQHSRTTAKYREPITTDASRLPILPDNWIWTNLDQLSWHSSYGTSERCDYHNQGTPVLRIPNVIGGVVDTTDIKRASSVLPIHGAALAPNDLLIVRTNGSKSLVGRGANISQDYEEPYFFASYLIRFRIINSAVAAYIGAIWNSAHVRRLIENSVATTAGQYNVSLSFLAQIPIPLPPLTQCKLIVAELEQWQVVADRIEESITNALKRAQRCKQSILRQALSGDLLPQNPGDAPAQSSLRQLELQSKTNERQSIYNTKRYPSEANKLTTARTLRSLIEVIRESNTIRVEDLFREAGYTAEDVDLFFRELYAIRSQIVQLKDGSDVILRLTGNASS